MDDAKQIERIIFYCIEVDAKKKNKKNSRRSSLGTVAVVGAHTYYNMRLCRLADRIETFRRQKEPNPLSIF